MFTIAEGLENIGVIKTGGQGSVYKGRRTGEVITAVKLLPTPVFSQSEEDPHYRNFINEVRKLQRVSENRSPNVVQLLSYGINEASGFPFIEMEYIDGPELAALLRPPYEAVFHLKEVVKFAEQLSNALAHCHKLGVKHGDIKSNNIRYNRQTCNFVLLDFGLAVLSDEGRRTSKQQAGAIEFMAPEQNEGKLFFETDVYSFGVVLFELLTGQVPFPLSSNSVTARNQVMLAHLETPPPDLMRLRASALPADWQEEKRAAEMQVPSWLVSTVYKCLQKAPANRFANGAVLHDYISDRHVRAAENAFSANKRTERPNAAAINEDEMQNLKAVVARQERELKILRQAARVTNEKKVKAKPVRKPAFYAALVTVFLVSGLAVYGLFFRHKAVDAASASNAVYTKHDTLANDAAQSVTVESENKSAAKGPLTTERKEKLPVNITAAERQTVTAMKKAVQTTLHDAVKKQTAPPAIEKENNTFAKSEKDSFDFFARYKVRGEAHFYTEPEEGTKRRAFITHWNNAILKPLDEQGGYVYVIFTNFRGETSRGWLAKEDLIKVK